MKNRVLSVLMGLVLSSMPALAQQKTITGKVTNELGAALSGVSVTIKGTQLGTTTSTEGNYSVRASTGQVLQYRFIGTAPEERTIGSGDVINVTLRRVASNLDAVVVTALGQTTAQRALGTAQQTVSGADVAQTQRENFVNALAGRVAGVDVTSTSGVPGASTSITIRGVSSISSSNQPLMIIDGLPVDNKTLNTNVLASDAPGSATAFNNRGIDFTNRAADFNPEDIETLTVLKGPEASALYGIDAANGAIVITTKRGKAGQGGLDYSNSFRIESTGAHPDIQHIYGPSGIYSSASTGGSTLAYFGTPYTPGTKFYDNVDGFFQTALTQKHNLSFSGAAADNRINYRVSGSSVKQEGVIKNSKYNRLNLTGASQAQVTNWLNTDLSMQYAYDVNDQPLKGEGGPLLGLLAWPDTNDAKNFLTASGQRNRLTSLASSAEIDNPYYSISRNKNNQRTNRLNVNMGFTLTPFSWGNIKSNIGADNYTAQYMVVRDPGSALGFSQNGILDQTDDITRNITAQTLLNINSIKLLKDLSITGLLGHQIQDNKSTYDALKGQDFLDPTFVSVNNTNLRSNRSNIAQRRLVSGFGQATLNYKNYLYVTGTGRNDWTSTIPQGRNSFFYPSISSSFIFSDAFPTIGKKMSGKLRAAFAEVGRDAKPYAYAPSLEFKTTSNGGYGYGFYGPNFALEPEFAKSYELGTELGFFDDRLGFDFTWWKKQTEKQIVNDLRGSYGTGFILFNLNGASTRNAGVEATLRGTPVRSPNFSWDFVANYAHSHGKVLSLPRNVPESYVSDTWLYGNVRNGTGPGMSTMSLTGNFYLRNNKGDLLIDPTTGLPIRSTAFIDAGYDRQPKYTIGLTNTLTHKRLSLDFLLDFRRGGDVFNATEHYLTVRGLSKETLDRETPRIIQGVIRDGKENSATPTQNTIVVIPSNQPGYYTNMSEELFIEKNINWVRLRDVTLRYQLPERLVAARNASVFITATDVFLITNYTGFDPIVNGNSAAVGGSGGAGIDYGNFPMPRGFNFGLKVGF